MPSISTALLLATCTAGFASGTLLKHDYDHAGYRSRKALRELREEAFASGSLKLDTALDQYVRKPDDNYRYEITNATMHPASPLWDGTIIKMYSQKWLTPEDWNRGDNKTHDAVWWHWMTLIVPKKLNPKHLDTAVIYVTGGENNPTGPPTKTIDEDNLVTEAVAMEMGVVGCTLFQIPNQPLFFPDEKPTPTRRIEDKVIAWTWKHFLENPGDPSKLSNETEWLARLPMTKAVVRAMDTITDARKAFQNIEHFIIAGASKRGWTTWTTSLVDARIIGIAPIVWDCLHMHQSLHHMAKAYGGWTFAFKDYINVNITSYIDSPEFELLEQIVDVYSYIPDHTRFLMPKLVINAGQDEFLQGDNDQFWWDRMPVGQGKNRLMVQNAEHSEATGVLEIIPAVGAWGNELLNSGGKGLPEFDWKINKTTGDIVFSNLNSEKPPLTIEMWHAHSWPLHGRRDWRILAAGKDGKPVVQPVIWTKSTLKETGNGTNTWIAHKDKPLLDWVAFFIEAKYEGPSQFWNPLQKNSTFRFTTQISIVPDVYPFEDCVDQECGKLELV